MGIKPRQRDELFSFGLAEFGQVYPAALSGGMRQRAALLRTILTEGEVLLLDEPFGALDALTRRELEDWLLDIWREFEKTILFITHDVDEALYLGDRVIVLSARPGRIVSSLEVELERPRHRRCTSSRPRAHPVVHDGRRRVGSRGHPEVGAV